MTSQFSPKVSEILAYSREEAARLASRSVGPEHLLLGLLRMKEGPVIDVLNKEGEMWVFGKDVKEREVYIKITLGYENGQTICISFHIAEHPLVYPFKLQNDESTD